MRRFHLSTHSSVSLILLLLNFILTLVLGWGSVCPAAWLIYLGWRKVPTDLKHRIKCNLKRKGENGVRVNPWSARGRGNWRYWTAPRTALLNFWGKANKSSILGIWDTHTSCLSSHQHHYSLFFSPTMCPNAFLLFSGFRNGLLTHGKDFLALGFVVWFCKGKFSSSSRGGTCGREGSHCSLVPL